MPCHDGGPSPESMDVVLDAMLCGIASTLEKQNCLQQVLDSVDWCEVGITRQIFDVWWAEHKQRDSVRRNAEQARRDHKQRRQEALDRLSPEDRRLLGL